MVGADPFIVAHRAANSVSALRDASDRGVAVCEGDVHLFWGRLEMRHLKTLGPIPILWDRWFLANPFQRRLLLGDLLRACPPSQRLMLDLKGLRPAVGRHVRRELAAFGRPIMVCSRHWAALARLGGLPNVTVVHSVGSPRQLRRLLRRFGPHGLSGVSIHRELLTPDVVRELRQRTDTIMVWPITTRRQVDELVAWGVRGLITTDTELLSRPASPVGRP